VRWRFRLQYLEIMGADSFVLFGGGILGGMVKTFKFLS
jgi:hypothetical protein